MIGPKSNYLCTLLIQRIGDRNNDIEVSNAGRYKFFDVFFGFKHPIYREKEYRGVAKQSIIHPIY